MKAKGFALVVMFISSGMLTSRVAAAVPSWFDHGLIWYDDPRSLTAEQHRALEIARKYVNEHFPRETAQRRYGGLIGDQGAYWDIQFTDVSIGTRTAGSISSDVELCVDKRTHAVSCILGHPAAR